MIPSERWTGAHASNTLVVHPTTLAIPEHISISSIGIEP